MPRASILSRHLVSGAVAGGLVALVACATATTGSEAEDAGTTPVFEAGIDAGPGKSDAPPLFPEDTGVLDDASTSIDATSTDATSTDGASDAALDMNLPDTFDAGFCATAPPTNLCGLDPQCGCGAGTCDIDRTVTTGATACTTAGATLRGRACIATSQCTQGDTCESGACRPFCTTLAAACNKTGTGKCVQAGVQAVAVPSFKVCEIECALHDANSCGGAGVGCIFDGTTGGTDCVTVGAATTCSATSTDCSPGNVCVKSGGGASYGCFRWCRIGFSATDCAGSGLTCSAFATPVRVNAQEYGACL